MDDYDTASLDTEQSIKELLDHLEGEDIPGDVLGDTVSKALRLSAALAQPWVYAPDSKRGRQVTTEYLEHQAEVDANRPDPEPPTDAGGPTGAELVVIETYTEWYDDVVQIFSRFRKQMVLRLRALERLVDRLVAAEKANLDEPGENFYQVQINLSDLSLDELNTDRLKEQMKTFRSKRNLFVAFRTAHGLLRAPKYEPSNVALTAIALTFIGIETLVNGTFFAAANDLGLIGGWGIAFAMSSIILGVSFVAGVVLTRKNGMVDRHKGEDQYAWARSPTLVISGWLGFAFLLFCVLLLVALICVYRDEASLLDPAVAYAQGGPTISELAMTETAQRLGRLELVPRAGIEGVLLIFANLIAVAVGVFKGYYHFDVVPGYRNAAIELAVARRKFRESIEHHAKGLGVDNEWLDAQASQLHSYTSAEVNGMLEGHRNGLEALNQLEDSINVQLRRTVDECNQRLRSYRDRNRALRPAPAPAPPHFDEEWIPPSKGVATPSISVRPLKAVDAEQLVKVLGNHRSAAIELIQGMSRKRYEDGVQEFLVEAERDRLEVNQKAESADG